MKPNKKRACLSALTERILTLDIEPGSLLDETALSKEYDLSRTPLREVFQRLAGNGYLTLEENRGAKVSSMNMANMRTFFQSAPMIYAAIARLAAENATPAQIAALKTIQSKFAAAVKSRNAHDMTMGNHSFHQMLGEMADNPYLTPALSRLLIDHTRMSQMFFRPKSKAERAVVTTASDQHDAMIAAIEAREPATNVDLTLAHWNLSRDRIEAYVRPDPLPFNIEDTQGTRHAV